MPHATLRVMVAPARPQRMPSLRLSMMGHASWLLAASLARQSLDGLPATFEAHTGQGVASACNLTLNRYSVVL
jgi:hypothetical protein